MPLTAGQQAPGFELPDADMEIVNLAAFERQHNVVLYFYPRDDTPGCTLEAIDFSDMQDEFAKLGTVVLGISMDDCLSHGSFRDKHGLSVRLLSDEEGEVCRTYGVLREKSGGEPRPAAIQRSTFVIDKRGRIRHALYGISLRGHAAQILNLIRGNEWK